MADLSLDGLMAAATNATAEAKSTYFSIEKFREEHLGKARLATQKFKLKDGSGSFDKLGIGFGETFAGIAQSVTHKRVKDANGEILKDPNGKTIWEPGDLAGLNHKDLAMHILSHSADYQVMCDARTTLQDGSHPFLIVPNGSFTTFGEELE